MSSILLPSANQPYNSRMTPNLRLKKSSESLSIRNTSCNTRTKGSFFDIIEI